MEPEIGALLSKEMHFSGYLYYLTELKGIANVEGEIDYPLLRKKERVLLTEATKTELRDILLDGILDRSSVNGCLFQKDFSEVRSSFIVSWVVLAVFFSRVWRQHPLARTCNKFSSLNLAFFQ